MNCSIDARYNNNIKRPIDVLTTIERYFALCADAEQKFITINGTHLPIDENGKLRGKVGDKIENNSKEVSEKRKSVLDAVQKISNGSPEETLPNLRNDLEQYGGTNDVTLIMGNKKEGLAHIVESHGAEVLAGVLEAVITGKVIRYVPANNTINLKKGNYEAVLSLERYKQKKTWLLTGFDVTVPKETKKKRTGEDSQFSQSNIPMHTEPSRSRLGMGAVRPYDGKVYNTNGKVNNKENCNMTTKKINSKATNMAFDKADSVRRFDENGFMHVGMSHITKATVNPYYGRDIPGWKAQGLNPDEIYYGLRDADELKKSVPTWEGLPLQIEHHIDSAEDPQTMTRVGAVGKAVWNAPYIDAPLAIWDKAIIEAIEDDAFRELSCAYRYDPDFTPGTFEGVDYDFIMRNIRGNHVALVEEGRAGHDVIVADSAIKNNTEKAEKSANNNTKQGGVMKRFKKWFKGAMDANPEVKLLYSGSNGLYRYSPYRSSSLCKACSGIVGLTLVKFFMTAYIIVGVNRPFCPLSIIDVTHTTLLRIRCISL